MVAIPRQKETDEARSLKILQQRVTKEFSDALALLDGLGTAEEPPVLQLVLQHPQLSVQELRLVDGKPELSRWIPDSVAGWVRGGVAAPEAREIIDISQLTYDECNAYLRHFAA